MMASVKDPEQKPHVLLVDDDPDLRRVFSSGLGKKGFQVVSAGSAEEAIRLAADPEVEIDVIVMDIVLPDSWGSQVAMEQGLFRPDVKVIYISGYSREDAVLQASSGNEEVHFLPKPFTVEELAVKIRAVLGGAPGGRDLGGDDEG
jgi:two-component system, cell cycle sensor histidine kinase and response regulator CckA